MAKILVLMFGNDPSMLTPLDAVVTGAKSIRFTETALRAAEHAVGRVRVLDDNDLSMADGVALVVAPDGASAFGAFVARVATNPSLSNTVFGVMSSAADDTMSSDAANAHHATVGRLVAGGGIVISTPSSADVDATARALGERVARVASWVRHSLGHEAEHAHGDSHSHSHAHDHDAHDHHGHTHGHSHDHA